MLYRGLSKEEKEAPFQQTHLIRCSSKLSIAHRPGAMEILLMYYVIDESSLNVLMPSRIVADHDKLQLIFGPGTAFLSIFLYANFPTCMVATVHLFQFVHCRLSVVV